MYVPFPDSVELPVGGAVGPFASGHFFSGEVAALGSLITFKQRCI